MALLCGLAKTGLGVALRLPKLTCRHAAGDNAAMAPQPLADLLAFLEDLPVPAARLPFSCSFGSAFADPSEEPCPPK
jgi:hypothetical protein